MEGSQAQRWEGEDGKGFAIRGKGHREGRSLGLDSSSENTNERTHSARGRTFLYWYNPVAALDVHSTAEGLSKGERGSQYSIMPATSMEMTVSYFELY